MAANTILPGFVDLSDQFGSKISAIPEEDLAAAIGISVNWHNERINEFRDLFANPTTDYKVNFTGISPGMHQPLDEFGKPKPIKSSRYTVEHPLFMAGSAIGWTYVAGQKMTVADVNRLTGGVLVADVNWMRMQILKGFFRNTNYTFVDPTYGSLTIKPLANGDTDVFVSGSGTSSAVDTHHLAQANAISTTDNPFPTIYAELTEHPENSGDIIAFVPTNLVSAIEGIAGYVEVSDPDIQLGSGSSRVVGSLGVPLPLGMTIKGKVDGVWIVEWPNLPSSYIIAISTGGNSPLRQREEPEATLQGLALLGEDRDTPLFQRSWFRRTGFSAWNRVGAVVMRIGNGTYAIPTGYSTPGP